MSENLEQALRRALGVELTNANGDPEEQLPSTPIALNDDNGLRAIIMREFRDHATNTARQKQTQEAGNLMIQAINNTKGN